MERCGLSLPGNSYCKGTARHPAAANGLAVAWLLRSAARGMAGAISHVCHQPPTGFDRSSSLGSKLNLSARLAVPFLTSSQTSVNSLVLLTNW
jgi:hypothetical protein